MPIRLFRRATAALALSLALAACQATASIDVTGTARGQGKASKPPNTAATQAPTATPIPPKTTASPTAPGATPTTPGTPAPTATPGLAAPASLMKPAGASQTLSGIVRIDAAYAILAGGAHLIANNGGTAVSAPGTLISNNAGNLIANNSAGLMGNNGSTLISDHGNGLIANNSAGLTAKTKLSLLQAEFAAPKVGEILPAAGLVLAVSSLRTGDFLPLGVGPDGKAVYAVLTNASGGFELYVPAEVGPVLLSARFPEAESGAQANPRLAYDLLATGTDTAPAIMLDEDTTQVTRYVRMACAGTMAKFVLTDDIEKTVANIIKDSPDTLEDALVSLVTELRAESGRIGLDKAPPAEAARVSERMTDVILSHMAIDDVALTHAYWPDWTGPEEPAIPALRDIMRRLREGATNRLLADPAFFDTDPTIVAENARLPVGAPRYEIRKPSDFSDFIVRALVIPDRGSGKSTALFAQVNVEEYQVDRMFAAVNNYIGAMGMTIFTNPVAKAEVIAAINSYKPAQAPPP